LAIVSFFVFNSVPVLAQTTTMYLNGDPVICDGETRQIPGRTDKNDKSGKWMPIPGLHLVSFGKGVSAQMYFRIVKGDLVYKVGTWTDGWSFQVVSGVPGSSAVVHFYTPKKECFIVAINNVGSDIIFSARRENPPEKQISSLKMGLLP